MFDLERFYRHVRVCKGLLSRHLAFIFTELPLTDRGHLTKGNLKLLFLSYILHLYIYINHTRFTLMTTAVNIDYLR